MNEFRRGLTADLSVVECPINTRVSAQSMKTLGHRVLPEPAPLPSGELLKFAAAVNDPVRCLIPDGKIAAPKGIYRFKTLEAFNRQQEIWLAEAMAEEAARRG